MRRVAVFASGNGTNFEALVKKQKKYRVVLLVCDQKDAYVIKRAEKLKVKIFLIEKEHYQTKEDYERAILEELTAHEIEFIACCGYMKIISPVLLNEFPNKILNIHPSLLPAFKGREAVIQACEYGVKVTGVTVHFVDLGIDTGKTIAQKHVTIKNNMTKEQLVKKIQSTEHKLYPKVLNSLLGGAHEESFNQCF